jgi:putative membrane protein
MWGWGPDWGWLGVLLGAVFWIGIIAVAVFLLRGEVPDIRERFGGSPALRLLEERYARGEISRDEFLERRAVLSQPSPPPAAPAPEQPPSGESSDSEPTQPQPPVSSA